MMSSTHIDQMKTPLFWNKEEASLIHKNAQNRRYPPMQSLSEPQASRFHLDVLTLMYPSTITKYA